LTYSKEKSHFITIGQDEEKIFPTNQETIDKLEIKIPLEKFTSGDIWKPVGIPGTCYVVFNYSS